MCVNSWTTTGEVAEVELSVLKAGVVEYVIGTFANTGSFKWVVPSSLPAGSYTLKVASTASGESGVADLRSVSITAGVAGSSINIVEPAGGEYFEVGAPMRIQWESDTSISMVSVSIRTKLDDDLVLQLASGVEDGNSLQWDVNKGDIAQAYVEVTGFNGGTPVTVARSVPFHIVDAQPRIFDVNPFVSSLGAIWSRGVSQTIRFDTDGPLKKVALQLHERAEMKQVLKSAEPAGSDMHYSVPHVAPPSDSSKYHVTVSSLEFPFTFGQSSLVFALNSHGYYDDPDVLETSSIAFTFPEPSSSALLKRRQYNLAWNSVAVPSVTLRLLQDNEPVRMSFAVCECARVCVRFFSS